MKVDDPVRHTADELAGNAASDDEKLKKIYDYCRKSIENTARMTKAERAELKPNKIPSDTIQQGAGSSKNIAMLFAALATAAGFDARYAKLADRSEVFFDPASPNYSNTYFMEAHNIAVRVGDQWRFFSIPRTGASHMECCPGSKREPPPDLGPGRSRSSLRHRSPARKRPWRNAAPRSSWTRRARSKAT